MVTGPRALANLTSSSRQIASIQHFPCEALRPPAQGFGGFQCTEKAQFPLGDNSPTRIEEGGRLGKGGLKGNRATHLQKPLSQMWGGGREYSVEAATQPSFPCLGKGPAARWRSGREEVRVRARQALGRLWLRLWLPCNLTLRKGCDRCQRPSPGPAVPCAIQTCAWLGLSSATRP